MNRYLDNTIKHIEISWPCSSFSFFKKRLAWSRRSWKKFDLIFFQKEVYFNLTWHFDSFFDHFFLELEQKTRFTNRDFFANKKPHCILSHALSLGMAIFLNIFGIVLTMGSAHVIARLPELFDRELIYLAIGCIFVSLMIENFAQGRSFHMVVEVESNKAQCRICIPTAKIKVFWTFKM